MRQILNGMSPATVAGRSQLATSAATLPGRSQLATSPRLRVGVLVEAQAIQRWQTAVLAELMGADFCELAVLVATGGSAAERRWSDAAASLRRRGIRRQLLYRLYERADRRRFGRPGDPMSPACLDAIALGSVLRLPDAGTSHGALPHAALDAIGQQELDVLVCLDANADLQLLAHCARFGAWTFEPAEGGSGAPLFREIFAADGDIVSTIHALTEPYGERIICRSSTSTEPVSLHRNRSVTHAKAAHLLLRCLIDVHRRGWDALGAAPLADVSLGAQRDIPTTGQMLSFLWRVCSRMLRLRLRRYLLEEEWYLAYRRHPCAGTIEALVGMGNSALARCTVVRPPRGHMYADPFMLRRNDRHFVFFEDYDRNTERGAISYIELDDRGRRSTARRALERDYHLSYPFLFSQGEEVYMVPETRSERRVELYRAASFPYEWKLERVLLEDTPAADSTLLHHQGMFWLFAAVAPDGGPPHDELHVFYADSLLGEWMPHPMNPVVANAGDARPAGAIFSRSGELIRPAQDCSRSYGRRVILNRIEVLDRNQYREIPVGSIEAGFWGSKTHCYNANGDYEAFDGCRFQPKVWTPRLRQRQANWAWGRFRIALSEPEPSDMRITRG